jgi:hypothetical protein
MFLFRPVLWRDPFDRQVAHDQIGKGSYMLVPSFLPDLDEAAQKQLGDAHGAIFKAKFLSEAKLFPRSMNCSHTPANGGSRSCWRRRRRRPSLTIISTCWPPGDLVEPRSAATTWSKPSPPSTFSLRSCPAIRNWRGRGDRRRDTPLRYRGRDEMRPLRDCCAIRQISRRHASGSQGGGDVR